MNIERIEPLKPLLKWIGGKTQIIDKIMDQYPSEINNYHEIFIGGGSVLFALLTYIKEGRIRIRNNIYASDLNKVLIYVYKNIQSRPNELYNAITILKEKYNSLQDEHNLVNINPDIERDVNCKESYYYWIRKRYNNMTEDNKISIEGSAIFIFLNKTGFRGLYRMSRNGYNVPYGNYKNPEIINEDHLMAVHNLIQNVIFTCKNYVEALNNVLENDFIYMDPPYCKETAISFVGYNNGGFKDEEHNILFEKCKEMNRMNIKWMMSNADVKQVKDSFIEDIYKKTIIECKRSINPKKPESKTNEVIIINYL